MFGDGHDYDWALAADDDQEIADEAEKKLDMKYRDVSQNDFLEVIDTYLFARSSSQLRLRPAS